MRSMDVNIKNVEPEILARLAQQAAAAGLSQQEWLRQTLRRTAARLSASELAALRESVTPMTEDEFVDLQVRAAIRRRASAEALGARRGRR